VLQCAGGVCSVRLRGAGDERQRVVQAAGRGDRRGGDGVPDNVRQVARHVRRQSVERISRQLLTLYAVLFCSLAFLDPRVGHTMDVLSPFISILCHSD